MIWPGGCHVDCMELRACGRDPSSYRRGMVTVISIAMHILLVLRIVHMIVRRLTRRIVINANTTHHNDLANKIDNQPNASHYIFPRRNRAKCMDVCASGSVPLRHERRRGHAANHEINDIANVDLATQQNKYAHDHVLSPMMPNTKPRNAKTSDQIRRWVFRWVSAYVSAFLRRVARRTMRRRRTRRDKQNKKEQEESD